MQDLHGCGRKCRAPWIRLLLVEKSNRGRDCFAYQEPQRLHRCTSRTAWKTFPNAHFPCKENWIFHANFSALVCSFFSTGPAHAMSCLACGDIPQQVRAAERGHTTFGGAKGHFMLRLFCTKFSLLHLSDCEAWNWNPRRFSKLLFLPNLASSKYHLASSSWMNIPSVVLIVWC